MASTPPLPRERLRDAVLQKLHAAERNGASRQEAIQLLFPTAILDDDVLESVTAALLSGTNLVLLGPPGSGKTSLAKDIADLYPREVVVVSDCPVQDDPLSLLDPAHAALHPACPACRAKYGALSYKEVGEFDPSRVDPKKVHTKTTRLREGHGFARLQGSPEVFPDYLTGAVNLAKLEEIGDPESPLVLEPGKLMQANRGVLIIDEIGKLPRGTQNVLLQALQESIVTPSKSRETFPASFFCVATSNLEDMDSIEEPLIGRFTSVYVPFNSDHVKNRAIVDASLKGARVPTTQLLREADALLVERWRKSSAESPDLGEVGSNRTMIDVLRRAEAHALLRGAPLVDLADFKRGSREAMIGRVRGRSSDGYLENRDAVDAFLAKQLPKALADAAMNYWCGYFVGILQEDKSEGERTGRELKEAAKDSTKVAGLTRAKKFAQYVEDLEGKASEDVRSARLALVLKAIDEGNVFEAKK